jgi:hypothetical protein
MRRLSWVFLVGCGSVTGNQLADAPPGDGGSAAPGTVRWVRSLSSVEALGIADGAGGLVVAGAITAPANLGGQALVPAGDFDMVVAGFDSETADHLFSVRHGDVGSEFGFLHHVDTNGAPILYGVSYGTVDLGTGKLAGGNGSDTSKADGYIGHFGPAAPAWISRIVGPGEDKILASAPGPGSTIYGAGYYEATTAFMHDGVNEMLTSTGGRDIFLARFNTFTGAVDLTRHYGGTADDEITGAAASSGSVIVTGRFGDPPGVPQGSLAFGGAAKPLTSNGGLDIFVAKLDGNGDGVWAVRYGGAGDEHDPRVAVDPAGDVYVTGSFTNQVAFGAVNLVSKGASDIFIVKLRGNDGSVAWAQSIGSTGDDGTLDIAADAAGHVVVAGVVGGAIDNATSAGGVDALIASFDAANGTPGWRKVFSTAGDDRSFAVTYGRNGDVYGLVNVGGSFDFGVPVIGAPAPSAVLLRIAP